MTGNASRTRGRARELQVIRHYQDLAFTAYRLSEGCADVVALKAGHVPKLIQVKSTKRPYDHFPPEDRANLVHEAIMAGAEPVLAWWPKNGRLLLIAACEWPGASRVRFPVKRVNPLSDQSETVESTCNECGYPARRLLTGQWTCTNSACIHHVPPKLAFDEECNGGPYCQATEHIEGCFRSTPYGPAFDEQEAKP